MHQKQSLFAQILLLPESKSSSQGGQNLGSNFNCLNFGPAQLQNIGLIGVNDQQAYPFVFLIFYFLFPPPASPSFSLSGRGRFVHITVAQGATSYWRPHWLLLGYMQVTGFCIFPAVSLLSGQDLSASSLLCWFSFVLSNEFY